MNFGMGEVIILLIIALIVFGPSRLPEMGKALGRTVREFKRATSGRDDDDEKPEIEQNKRAEESSS